MAELKCTSCGCGGFDADGFKEHCKSAFHTFNLKRKVAGLGPITLEAWEKKKAAAEAKEEVPKARRIKEAPRPKVVEPEPAPEEVWTPYQCIFCPHVSDSVEQNVGHMSCAHSFFVPDREYVKDPLGLLAYLQEKVQKDRTCLFCNKIFRSMHACRAHMIDSGHTRIGTDSDTLLGEIGPFYDFSESHRELVTKLGMQPKGKALANADEESTDEGDTSGDLPHLEKEEDGDWEECSSDASDLVEVHECEDEDDFADLLEQYGLQRAELMPSGDLRLPNGNVACHRSVAYVYKQKFHHSRFDPPDRGVSKRQQLALGLRPASAAGGGALAVAFGTRQVKRQNRQVLAILKDSSKQWVKLGMNNNKGDVHGRNKSVKVNLYSWAK